MYIPLAPGRRVTSLSERYRVRWKMNCLNCLIFVECKKIVSSSFKFKIRNSSCFILVFHGLKKAFKLLKVQKAFNFKALVEFFENILFLSLN